MFAYELKICHQFAQNSTGKLIEGVAKQVIPLNPQLLYEKIGGFVGLL
jgi:hypothetical protein